MRKNSPACSPTKSPLKINALGKQMRFASRLLGICEEAPRLPQNKHIMKTITTIAITALASAALFTSCTTVVDPTPAPTTTTQQTTTSAQQDPYTGSTTYKKTTTTNY